MQRLRGFVRRPTPEQLIEIGRREYLNLSQAEAVEYAALIGGVLADFDRVEEIVDPGIPEAAPRRRDPGRPATSEEDPYNVFIRRCFVEGDDDGPLKGKKAAVKDNIAIAGVPLTNGSRTSSYVPTEDATVVTRLLEAGADIVGTLNMDDVGGGGLSETSAFGPTANPYDPKRSPGGSSSGAGAAVAAGLVDIAIAVDQGGSARIPAGFCGVSSLKPTLGLIPSFGVGHMDHTLDSVCATARTVAEVAQVTDLISGHDDRDPQWVRALPEPSRCADVLGRGVEGMTVGVITEASTPGYCDENVLAGLAAAREALIDAGANVVDVSIPLWRDAWSVAVVLLCQLNWAMIQTEGQGFGHLGRVEPDRVRAFALSRRAESDDAPPFRKIWLLLGRYMHEEYLGYHVAKAQNLRAAVRKQIDSALERCDALMTATTPVSAPELLTEAATDTELLDRALTGSNTGPLNITGHPTFAVPCGLDEAGMPRSVQIAARHFGEATSVRVAEAIEARLPIPPPPSHD